jgi:hypothetical protein
VSRPVPVRTVLAEARQRAVDEAGVQLLERRVAGAEPIHHAGAEALDDDVGAGGELAEDGLALGGLHVERHRALVAVDEGVDGAADRLLVLVAARLGSLDLEHIGAHVRHDHAGHLGRRHARELQDLDSVEHTHG